jgi:hypothetical protein
MAVKTFTNEILTASDTNTYLANAGYVYVASKTFTTTTAAQQIDNCFTSTYDSYRIMWAGTGSTTGNDYLYVRLVDGTTPTTAANYYRGIVFSSTGNSLSNSWVGSQTTWQVGVIGDNYGQVQIDLANPQVATKTTFTSNFFSSATGDALWGFAGGLYNTTTQFEGLQMYPGGSQSWSGTITVLGLRKA